MPLINTKLNHLLVILTTSPNHTLTENECINHMLTTYAKICHPEQWVQWVCTQEDHFEDGLILDAQAFKNQAAVKYEKIKGDSEFHSSTKTI